MQKLIVRTSDTNQFRRCRVAWDMSSKIRLNFEFARGIEPLDFGSAIHEAMEVLYDPQRWNDKRRDIVRLEASAAFMRWMLKWRKRMEGVGVWENEEKRWRELVELGEGMLDHYVAWDAEQDDDWTPEYAEVEFEIPIPVPKELQFKLPPTWVAVKIKGLEGLYLAKYIDSVPHVVFFQGRIDVVVLDNLTGRYWIVDHKTAAQFPENTAFMDMDAQAGRYCWALKQQLGIDVEGVIFNQMRKKLPVEPDLKQDGTPSRNKSQKTTPELYRAKVRELGLNIADYEDFLSYFQGQEYFRRVETFRSEDEMDAIGLEIIGEAIDMLSDPWIYRNPSQFHCNGCQFRAACQMRFEGGDWEWFLENSGHYMKRS